MGIEGLDKIFNPRRIAVIGASNQEGSVGFRLFNNLIGVGFRGFVFPVNPFSESIQGIVSYPNVKKIPWQVDLAIIATPAHVVPQVVAECGDSGITGIIIISAGFGETGSEGKDLEKEIVRLRETYGLRIIGPNCFGMMRPTLHLNATFANKTAKPGHVAFISQSGALCASVLDWSAQANVGFSNFVSVGGMIDVNFADLIDYFGTDAETMSIVLFIESIANPRMFMSAARRFAGTKPIIVVKAGRSPEGMKVAASHTAAIMGEDSIYQAFFDRVGIVRVEEIADLFNCSEILAMQPRPRGPNLTIITNGGGPGVIATDVLISKGGKLAILSDETIQALDNILPHFWNRSNPVDVCQDATVERFMGVLETCFGDPNTDAYMFIYAPSCSADPLETANSIIKISKKTKKPILTCWLGEEDVQEARNVLRKNGIPAYSTPEQAVGTFMYMYQYTRNLELLYETPEEIPVTIPESKGRLYKIIEKARKQKREILTEPESKEILEIYGIPTTKAKIAKTPEVAATIASRIGFPVAMKIHSSEITHKTRVGGVILNIGSKQQVRKCFDELMERMETLKPSVTIEGVTVQSMVASDYEMIIGSKRDPQFGPVIIFGTGGTHVELFNDLSVGFPPLNQTLARRMMEQTRVYKILTGDINGKPPVDIRSLEEILIRFSQLTIDLPQIREVDINPLIINEKGVKVLDARFVMDLEKISSGFKHHQHLIIRPYPTKYVKKNKLKDGTEVLLRPVRSEDEPLISELFQTFSEETMRLRFFQIIKEIPHQIMARYCNVDYDREIAIVAEISKNIEKYIVGMGRLVVEPDGRSSEISMVVGDPWQNKGIGSLILDHMIGIGKDMELESVFAEVLTENRKIRHMCQKRGFDIKPLDEETYKATLGFKKSKQ